MHRRYAIKLLATVLISFITAATTSVYAQGFCWDHAVNKELRLGPTLQKAILDNPVKSLSQADSFAASSNLNTLAKAWEIMRVLDTLKNDPYYSNRLKAIFQKIKASSELAANQYVMGSWEFRYCGSLEKPWPNQIELRSKLVITSSSVKIFNNDKLVAERAYTVSLISQPSIHNRLFFDFNFTEKAAGIVFRVGATKTNKQLKKRLNLYYKSNCGDFSELVFEGKE